MLDISKVLKYSEFFKGINQAALTEIAECCIHLSLPAGTQLITQDTEGDYDFYILTRGEVHIIYNYMDYLGRMNEMIFTALEREVVGEISALLHCKRTATVRCKTPIEAIQVNGISFMNYLELHHDVGFAIMRNAALMLSRRLANTTILLKERITMI